MWKNPPRPRAPGLARRLVVRRLRDLAMASSPAEREAAIGTARRHVSPLAVIKRSRRAIIIFAPAAGAALRHAGIFLMIDRTRIAPRHHGVGDLADQHHFGGLEALLLHQREQHGCVRLLKANAAVLFALVKEQGLKATKVVLVGEIPDAVVARRDPGSIYHEEDTSVPQRARASRGLRENDYGAPPPYYYRERPYYAPRRSYGGFPFGW